MAEYMSVSVEIVTRALKVEAFIPWSAWRMNATSSVSLASFDCGSPHIRYRKCSASVRSSRTGGSDFPFRARGGSTVYLCWKLGEPAIRFWHGTDEGFAGRKSLDRLPPGEA